MMQRVLLPFLVIAFFAFGCQKKTSVDPPSPACQYLQWTGTETCSLAGSYPISKTKCCPEGRPFSTSSDSCGCFETCLEVASAFPNQAIYRYNDDAPPITGGTTTGGTTTGGTTTGGTTTGGSPCPSMNSYISFVSVVFNACTNNSGATFTFKNNSTQKLEVRIPIKLLNGTYSCQFATPNAGATFNVWTCNSTNTYGTIKSMLYSDWINNCSFGACP